MENIDCLILNDSVNQIFYVKNSLQDRMKVVHLDELDSVMLSIID